MTQSQVQPPPASQPLMKGGEELHPFIVHIPSQIAGGRFHIDKDLVTAMGIKRVVPAIVLEINDDRPHRRVAHPLSGHNAIYFGSVENLVVVAHTEVTG